MWCQIKKVADLSSAFHNLLFIFHERPYEISRGTTTTTIAKSLHSAFSIISTMTTTLNTCDEEVDSRPSFVSDDFEGSTFEYIDHYFRLEGGKGYLPNNTGHNRWYKSNQAAILKLLEFRLKNGHCNFKIRDIPSTHHQSIKDWRRMWRDPTPTPKDSRNPISQKKIDDFRENLLPVLYALDFVWDPRDASWMDKYELLKKFQQEHHHTQVPQFLEVNGVKLGHWVAGIRSDPQYHQGERKRLLDALGFEWRLVQGQTKTTRERVKGVRDSGWLAAGVRASLFDMEVARGHVRVLNAYSKQFPGRKFPYPFLNNKEARESKLIQQTKATYLWRRDLQRAYSAGVEIPTELDVSYCCIHVLSSHIIIYSNNLPLFNTTNFRNC